MKRPAFSLTLVTALLLSATVGIYSVKPVNARTITVPNDYPTIQSAIDAANNGDTVFVKSGYYPETLVINKSISLIGEDRNSTIIDAQKTKKQVILVQGDNIIVTNFTLGNNGYGPSTSKYWTPENGEGDGVNILPVSNSITIVNNTIIGCLLDGINAHFSQHNFIAGNIIINSAYGILVTCVESTIANNIFANVSVGIEFTTYEARVGVDGGEQSWILNESNVIQGNQNITLTTIPSPFPSPSPEPTSAPFQEPQQTPQLEIIIVVIIIVIVLVVGLGLLLYLIKRK